MNKAQFVRLTRRQSSTAAITPVPLNTVAPVVSASNKNVGTIATVSNGTWLYSPTSYVRRWYRNGVVIAGQTGPTYTFQSADEGLLVTADIIASNTSGASLAKLASGFGPVTTVQAGAPVNTAAPTVTAADTNVGTVATLSNGAWTNSPTSYARRWYRDAALIAGETGGTYTLATADVGKVITGDVVADNGTPSAPQLSGGFGPVTAGGATTPVPFNTAAPTITGSSFVEGSTATLGVGTWTNNPSSYTRQWYRGSAAISGATNAQYTFVSGDIGFNVTGQVVASNATGPSVSAAVSNQVGPIQAATVSGFTLNSTTVEIGIPKVLTPVNNNGNITAANVPINQFDISLANPPTDGFSVRPVDNTVQWIGFANDQAGTFTLSLTDGDGPHSIVITKLMTLLNNQIETNAPVKGGVGWVLGVPTGAIATMSGSLYFELKSYTNAAGARAFWIRKKLNGSIPIGSYTVTIAATGAQTVSATINVVADTGAAAAWPDPTPPTPPQSPLTTRTSTRNLLSGDVFSREQSTGDFHQYVTPVASSLTDVTISDFTGNNCGLVVEHSKFGATNSVNNLVLQRIAVNDGFVNNEGQGLLTTQGHKHTNNLAQDMDYQSNPTSQTNTANAIYGALCLKSKDGTVAYGGNNTWRRVRVDGMYMASFTATGVAIPFPNGDGISSEMFYTQLGPHYVSDVNVKNLVDSGVDWKSPAGAVISRVKVWGTNRQSVKDWNYNIWEFLKTEGATKCSFMRKSSPKTTRAFGVIRQHYSGTAATPAIRFESGDNCLMLQKTDYPTGQVLYQFDTSVGAVLIVPDGSLRESTLSGIITMDIY